MLKDASLLVDVVVAQTGFSGRTVTVDVEDEGRIIGSEKALLPADGSPATVRVRAVATESGPRLFKFRVAPQDGEVVPQNNAREALVNVRDVRERILYYEGEPRFEMKFIRRAVADDKNLLSVALQRTADNKYMRLDGEPDEVVGGFPKTRDELFRYRGLILGSIEAGAFSGDQLQMIADFVDRRGGGLLMLGGPRSFAEGGLRRHAGGRRAAAADRSEDARLRPGAAGAAEGVAHQGRRRPRRHADHADAGGVGGALGRAAAGVERERAAAAQGRARRRCSPAPTSAAATRSCWRRSRSAAARPSPSPRRTRGNGRCTRRFRSRIRPTSSSGAS